MGFPLQHVTPGQRFAPQAGEWNAFVDAARAVNEGRVIFGVPRDGSGAATSEPLCLRIRGTIDSWVDGPHGRAAIVTAVRKMGVGDVPQLDGSNQILVYDPTGDVFVESESALLNRTVWADFTSPVSLTTSCAAETGTAGSPTSTCRWEASGVGCDAV